MWRYDSENPTPMPPLQVWRGGWGVRNLGVAVVTASEGSHSLLLVTLDMAYRVVRL